MRGRTELQTLAVAVEIERFLDGESDGAALFQRLFGAVAAQPVPERLLAVVAAKGRAVGGATSA